MNEKKISHEIEAMQKLINLAKDDEQDFIQVSKSDMQEIKNNLLKGKNVKDDNPWFAIGEDKQLYTLVSLETLKRLVGSLRVSQEENFKLKLEKTIWKYVPVDFGDAWAVAMSEIEAISKKEPDSEIVNINLNHLVKNIKKKYPNLFLNLDNFLPSDFKQLS